MQTKIRSVFGLLISINYTLIFTVSSNDTLFKYNYVTFLLLLLFSPFFFLRKPIRSNKDVMPIVLFYILVVFSNLWAFDFSTSLHRSIGIGYYIFQAFVLYLVVYNGLFSMKSVGRVLFTSMIILTISAFYEYFILGFTRSGGLLQNANEYSLFILLAGYILLMRPKELITSKRYGIVFMMVLSVVISGSRKSILAIVFLGLCNVILKLLKQSTKVKGKKVIKVICALFGILLAVYLFLPYLTDSISSLTSLNRLIDGNDFSSNIRKTMKMSGRLLIQERPFLGFGLDSFSLLSGIGTYSHDNYIELMVSLGVIGLMSYYLIYISIILSSYRDSIVLGSKDVFKHSIVFIALLMLIEPAYVTFHSTYGWTLLIILNLTNKGELFNE